MKPVLWGSYQFPSTKGMGRIFHDRTGMKPILGKVSLIPINKENWQIIPWPDENETSFLMALSIPIDKGNGQIIPWPDGNETNSLNGIINSHQQRELAEYSMTGREWNKFLEGSHQFPSTKGMGRLFHDQIGMNWEKGHPFHSSKEFCRTFLNRTRIKPIVWKGNGQDIPWPVGNEIYPRMILCFVLWKMTF